MRRITDESLSVMREMRNQGKSYSYIAQTTGHSRSRIYTLLTKGFVSKCKYECSNCGGPTSSERRLCNKPQCRKIYNREHQRDNRTWFTYGLKPEDLSALRESQNNSCALCDRELDENTHVDHDHETGEVRGLLCHRCNVGLGYLLENPALLRKAADYIEGHRTKCQLQATTTS